jgi:hypothetical protein
MLGPRFFGKNHPRNHAYALRFFFAFVSLRHLHVSRVYARVTRARRMVHLPGHPRYAGLVKLPRMICVIKLKIISQVSDLSVSPRLSININIIIV